MLPAVATPSPQTAASTQRPHNFSAGPAALPEEVLREAQEELWSLFVPGGATLQFAMVPMNFLPAGEVADYLDTGVWAHKAIHEASIVAEWVGARVHVAFDGRPQRYDHVPTTPEIQLSEHAAYLHYCSNNTVFGTQFSAPPETSAQLICDASSDILSRPFDFARHALVYASGQKNLGPSGMCVVIAERTFIPSRRRGLPSMLDYHVFEQGESRPNTPNTWGIYLVGRVARWILRHGGVEGMARRNAEKARTLYAAIDRSGGFYTGLAKVESRSTMNVSFRLPTPELDDRFAGEAARQGMDGLKGHRDAGGIRASNYNSMSLEGCATLAEFMDEFRRLNG
jgi:phosphoserine aminotransferase